MVWALFRWSRGRRTIALEPGGDGDAVAGTLDGATSPVLPASPPIPPNRTSVPVSAEQVRLSERIVIALAREGRLGDDALVRPARTQAGLAGALDSNQSAVSKVLRRLVAAGLLTEERRHVQGRNQRLKVYALTRRGEQVAREVARRRNLRLLPDRPAESDRTSPPPPG